MPTTRKIQYTDERVTASIIVRAALIPDQYRREIWRLEAAKHLNGDQVMNYMRLILHPDLCSVVDPAQSSLSVEGVDVHWPLEFESFAALPALPESLLDDWLKAARELNPTWSGVSEAEKKDAAMTSTVGSRISTSRRRKGAKGSNTQT